MCVLRLSSKSTSLKPFILGLEVPYLSLYDAGEFRDKNKTRLCKEHQATLDVSQKEWDDLEGQIDDATEFLENYNTKLTQLFNSVNDLDGVLDFRINSKLDGNFVTQGITFPKHLVVLAGELKIGLGITIYESGMFE